MQRRTFIQEVSLHSDVSNKTRMKRKFDDSRRSETANHEECTFFDDHKTHYQHQYIEKVKESKR